MGYDKFILIKISIAIWGLERKLLLSFKDKLILDKPAFKFIMEFDVNYINFK